jgi:hypothetical protein
LSHRAIEQQTVVPRHLSELLERIRPAGAPGAPSEGDRQRDEFDRAHEVAGIASVLAGFEEEVGKLIGAANKEAEQIRVGADLRANQIRSSVPDRIAKGQAQAMRTHLRYGAEQRDSADHEVALELARRRGKAQRSTAPRRPAAIDSIGSMLPPGDEGEDVA